MSIPVLVTSEVARSGVPGDTVTVVTDELASVP